MYHYVKDKAFLKNAQNYCAELLSDLTKELLEADISSQFFLVGSGGRNMVSQNENESIDFDYNLNIQKCRDINDCRTIKETIKKTFNKVLKTYGLYDCDDSTSTLTTKPIYFKSVHDILFSIDVCIVTTSDRKWYRLIHEKTGCVLNDKYFWNEAPHSQDIKKKADCIKESGNWEAVRQEYLRLKNTYLTRNDHNHPSFVCYIEAVNNLFNKLRQKHIV